MADDTRDGPRPFDVRTVEYLLKIMTDHGLSEIYLQEGDHRIRLRKPGPVVAGLPPLPAAGPGTVAGANPHPYPFLTAAVAPPTAPAPPPPPPPPARALHEIRSPMVGTFYSKPKPDKPDFVTVGSIVKPDTVVCLIEAMKLYNDIKAEVSGRIVEVCVKNGDPVEYNQVLFRVEPL